MRAKRFCLPTYSMYYVAAALCLNPLVPVESRTARCMALKEFGSSRKSSMLPFTSNGRARKYPPSPPPQSRAYPPKKLFNAAPPPPVNKSSHIARPPADLRQALTFFYFFSLTPQPRSPQKHPTKRPPKTRPTPVRSAVDLRADRGVDGRSTYSRLRECLTSLLNDDGNGACRQTRLYSVPWRRTGGIWTLELKSSLLSAEVRDAVSRRWQKREVRTPSPGFMA
ncbi:hypothetical protein BDY21DRAFT_342363 [Lineolata rhizophorae]|uniref:Uncharacterized protein n=1 Tax=Lineolata rhizophorae TaxID=578093 RepID=A0A6A6P3J1_9PEZI|nr:hypothetical protein BDY21DRAFT_342363 [Lineolata rhizophorae]